MAATKAPPAPPVISFRPASFTEGGTDIVGVAVERYMRGQVEDALAEFAEDSDEPTFEDAIAALRRRGFTDAAAALANELVDLDT